MTDLSHLVAQRLAPIFADVAGTSTDPAVRRSDHADYQADGALALAKTLRRPPRDIAGDIAAVVVERAGGVIESAEVAGPGFINLTLNDAAIASLVEEMASDERLGVDAARSRERVVIDYSGPNVGKELHVGHLRSTIIGDALARLLEFLGHQVIRQNHLGDWGTTFGMLIERLLDTGADPDAGTIALGDITDFYQQARAAFDADEDFATRARRRVVLLQEGDPQTHQLWQLFIDESTRHFQAVYDALGISLTATDNAGESTYNDGLPGLVAELDEAGLLTESDGALCVFPADFTGREGKPLPIIVRKRDGGYNYETTDLVAIRRRLLELAADRVSYVVGAEQQLRLDMLFAVARAAGWLRPPARVEHVGFGMVLGPDRKRLRTRSGDLPKLVDLLDEAVRRADTVVADKAPHLDAAERASVARAVGIGAIKYADLSGDRVKDYVFDLDQMISFDGNTAPYLQYAHARIQSVFRRGAIDPTSLRGHPVVLTDPAERDLALLLGEFEGALVQAAESSAPHRVCTYAFTLATTFTHFYERCPVLRADDQVIKHSRLILCDVTSRVLATGLALLGISTPTRM